ncbi:AAA family ATPase [Kitasatospora sp. NBC_01287]|uniref:AAA family ATPase n=1 Tax=Kitasatospora sp. NBC_01287 TaxID=2903573 RepID=UPI002252CF8B|nr:AAA family ATPase [Kitasatospora sp. NBC_01287]MCX4745128.1 AAA family ATPase [Kitasatospora sp. NBC_01287]
MTEYQPGGLTLLSTAASSGKSLLARSFAAIRRAAGLDVSMYKPLAVMLQPYTEGDHRTDLSMYLGALASGEESVRSSGICSYVAEPTGSRATIRAACGPPGAELGAVPRISEDGLDLTRLDDTAWQTMVDTCAAALHARPGFVITEGAGGATDAVARDLSNQLIACEADHPVLLVAGARRGGAVASVMGTWSLLRPDCRELVSGFVVNGVEHPEQMRESVKRAEEAMGVPCLGIIPMIPLFATSGDRGAGVPILSTWEEEIRHVAEFVRPFLADELIGALESAHRVPAF